MKCIPHPQINSTRPAFCYSPAACREWGYCRNRNFGPKGVPDKATQAEWKKLDE